MRKTVTCALIGFAALTASATSAAAATAQGLSYTGYSFGTKAACEQFWTDTHGGPQNPTGPHECRQSGSGYALWA